MGRFPGHVVPLIVLDAGAVNGDSLRVQGVGLGDGVGGRVDDADATAPVTIRGDEGSSAHADGGCDPMEAFLLVEVSKNARWVGWGWWVKGGGVDERP